MVGPRRDCVFGARVRPDDVFVGSAAPAAGIAPVTVVPAAEVEPAAAESTRRFFAYPR